MKLPAMGQTTMMSKKLFSMLLGGTLTMLIVSLMLMSDSVIAGAVIGSDAVAGITLVTPLYSLAAFFGSVFSLGVPLIYAKEMGKFNKDRADRIFGGLVVILGEIFGLYGMFIGLAAAPALAYIFVMLYLAARYGREDCPLLLSKVPGRDDSYFMEQLGEDRRHLTTMSFNRSAFLIKRQVN